MPVRATAATDALFVPNHGQYPAHVRYAVPSSSHRLWASDDAVWMVPTGTHSAVRLAVRVGGERPLLSGAGRTGPAVSYYRGSRQSAWLPRLATHRTLVYSSRAGDARVTVRARPDGLHVDSKQGEAGRARLLVSGAPIAVDASGEAYLWIDGVRRPLELRVTGDGFLLEGFDRFGVPVSREIPGMPVREQTSAAASHTSGAGVTHSIVYGSFLGSTLADEAEAIHFHGGDVFLAGHTQSLNFPATPGRFSAQRFHVVNAFVARLVPTDPGAGYVTVFQGSDLADGEEYGFALETDAAGNAVVAGNTNSDDFPVTAGAYSTRYGGNIDGFVARLAPDGTLSWATFLGGGDFDSIYGLALDPAGRVYVAGGTWSADFPTSPNAWVADNVGQRDAFVAVLDAAGANLVYGSYLGGTSQEQAEALALDAAGRVHVAGWTRSADFGSSLVGQRQAARAQSSPFDAFVARLDPNASGTDYAVTLGGTGEDRADAIAVDGSGRAIVAGRTGSDDFPATAGAFDESYGGGVCSFEPCPDAFVALVDTDASGLVYATYFGGGDWDEATAVAVGGGGEVAVAGVTHSADLPMAAALDAGLDGTTDAFVARFDASGANLEFASYLGGADDDAANAVGIDATGRLHVSGETRSQDFPVTAGAYSQDLAGDYDAYAVVIASGPADADGDGIDDAVDNCSLQHNADQRDSNGDGFGNLCDEDLNGDCAINFGDLAALKAVFLSSDADADFNGDGSVNFGDLARMKARFLGQPGPSGLVDCS